MSTWHCMALDGPGRRIEINISALVKKMFSEVEKILLEAAPLCEMKCLRNIRTCYSAPLARHF